ncbi:conserved Plasmodium protein, unknown function [Plasmodium gallinaceum]|uniref:Uncharacterized protein n=1 Tax=Plasmodium gallinaceum TaxID=5849 RepID=A0A1J1GP04_PLAGA|nr:conserved Plasmodium protein, unknown function [Plasmodium gallinaceum]CRG94194.1 conserved Plasmodium protein, unknown function [Plasmodium gallinaceum]
MKNLKGSLKLLNSNINIEEKKKIWLNIIKSDTVNLKGIGKNLKNVALSFFKENYIYNEENLIILNSFCKEKLDEYLVNHEIIDFLQKIFLFYEYFISEQNNDINKKQFIENVCDCCKRIFLKNIIKYEKEILDFLLKNLINYINKYSFTFIYQSLYNIYQYHTKSYRKLYHHKNERFNFLLNLESVKINDDILLINNNRFYLDNFFMLDENDEKNIRERFSEKKGNGIYNNLNNMQNEQEKKEKDEEDKKKKRKDETTFKNGEYKPHTLNRSRLIKINNLNEEFICFYMFKYFKSCFDNINFYLIEKFIENYYVNHNNENIYKELFLFFFLIYNNKMHNIVDRIFNDTINYLNNCNNLEIKKKKKLLNNESLEGRNLCLNDFLFYFELLINIITYKNFQYENNYEYYINYLKLLHENNTFQELFIDSFFFVFVSVEEDTIRNILLVNFVKYFSKKYLILSKLFMNVKNIFHIIYDINDKNIIYNENVFNNISTGKFLQYDKENSIKIEFNYLSYIAKNICIDKYICLFFKEVYYIISKSNIDFFCYITQLYLYIYDNILNKTINIIYENEMNLNDNSFDICKRILKPFLFVYLGLFDNFVQKLKKKLFSEKVMLSFSFLNKYLFKNMFEKTFLQKDLFYVIYQIYFLLYSLKYNFLSFLTNIITTKRKINEYLVYFLKMKEQNCKNNINKEIMHDEIQILDKNSSESDTHENKNKHNRNNENFEDYNEEKEEEEKEEEEKEDEEEGDEEEDEEEEEGKERKKSDCKYSYIRNKNKDIKMDTYEKKERKLKKKSNCKNGSNETSDEEINKGIFNHEKKKDINTHTNHEKIYVSKEGKNNNNHSDKKNFKKIKIMNFFEKNYSILKYFESNTENILEKYCTTDLNESLIIKEKTKLKKISHNKSVIFESDEKVKFRKKLNHFYDNKIEIDEIISELFLYNKDNIYSKILKNNLLIIKELKNIKMEILYPIFNSSLVFLFDDFYFFIIQNIKLVIEGKEKNFSDHKIFLNISLILLHCLTKDVKIEKYLVSIFYILKLSFNKLKSLQIIDEIKNNDINEIYNKNKKCFENIIKYYNIKKDKFIKFNVTEKNEDYKTTTSLHHIEEEIRLHQNIFYIFLKLLQNISEVHNLYYNFKFIIYDILFSEYSNKSIIFSCLKCILDKSKLNEIYNYCLKILNDLKVDNSHLKNIMINENFNNPSNTNNSINDENKKKKEIKTEEKKMCNLSDNYNNNHEKNKDSLVTSLNESNIKRKDYSLILLNNQILNINFLDYNNINNKKVSSLYINIIIFYYIIKQNEKNNKKGIYDNYIKLNLENFYDIINKFLCILYSTNSLNSYYDKYLKYLCLKVFKRIYNYFLINEAEIYLKHLKNNSTENIINEDKKLNDLKYLKNQIRDFFEFILNKEIKNYFRKENSSKIPLDEYKFFFLNNLRCNSFILKNTNFIFLINSMLFIFNIKYDKYTFYKMISIILLEKNEGRNYILRKLMHSIKKFFKISYIYNNVKRENKKNKIRLNNELTRHSVLLYIIRITVILFLLIDYNQVNKEKFIKEDYINYSMFINDYVKKKSLEYYYTQLNFLLFRIFYDEKNLPHFFKIFFSTLYIISFKKRDENMSYFFDKIFNIKNDYEMILLKDKASINHSFDDKDSIKCEKEKKEKVISNFKKIEEINDGMKNINANEKKRKNLKENSDKENNIASDEKNYHKILRSYKKYNELNENDKNNNSFDMKNKNYIEVDSSHNSSNDSDESFRININTKNKKKNSNNKKNISLNQKKNTTESVTYTSKYNQLTEKKKNSKDEVDEELKISNTNEKVKLDENEKDNLIKGNFIFNASLSIKILNHFIFLCKGFHEDLELKIYNGIVMNLKENENDREKLKNLLKATFIEDDKTSIKYKKKLELLRIIETKIIFLNYIKNNLEKRKSLITRMSEVNLNIFKNKSTFNIEIDFI